MRRLQHSDEPVTEGALLQRDAFVGALAEQIASCTPPQVFGVHGEWGAGKTSLLRQLQRHLSDPESSKAAAAAAAAAPAAMPVGLEASKYDDQVFTIWFEAWRYQHETVPVIALLQEMRRQFGLALRAKEALKAGSMIALKALVGAFDTVIAAVGAEHAKLLSPANIVKAAQGYDAEHFRSQLPSDTVREFLQDSIAALLKGLERDGAGQARIVIFIDDLDRCSSDAAFRLLEGLKIHLTLPNCVFVLGMNQGAVIDLLTPQFSKKEDEKFGGPRAESYLEKLCATVWRLPPVRDPLALLGHWLFVDAGPLPNDQAIGERDLQKRIAKIGNAEVLRRSLPPNPRKLKALANTLLMLWQGGAKAALKTDGDDADADLRLQCFVFLAYVYQFHQSLYQRWALAPDFFEAMRDWAQDRLSDRRKPIFERLVLTAAAPPAGHTDEKSAPSAAAASTAQSLYPEPGLHGLFWMTPWLLHSSGGGLATATMFEPLLAVYQGPIIP